MGTPKARRRKKQRFREVEQIKTEESKELPNALKAVEEKVVPKVTKPAPKRQTRKRAATATTTKKKTTRRRKSSSTS